MINSDDCQKIGFEVRRGSEEVGREARGQMINSDDCQKIDFEVRRGAEKVGREFRISGFGNRLVE